MGFAEGWERYEVRRVRRCREANAAADLLGGVLLLPASAFLLWRALAPGLECGAQPVWMVTGLMFFGVGWSSLGRAFWTRLVWRLRSGRLSDPALRTPEGD